MTWQKILLPITITLLFCFLGLNLVSAQVLNLKNSRDFINQTATYAGVSGQEQSLPLIAARVIQALLGLVGTVFIVLFIYGGFLYMTSGGNDEKIKKGKDLLKNAIIGLFIIMAAYSIAYFISSVLENAAT